MESSWISSEILIDTVRFQNMLLYYFQGMFLIQKNVNSAMAAAHSLQNFNFLQYFHFVYKKIKQI
jgi:hypothetical protein